MKKLNKDTNKKKTPLRVFFDIVGYAIFAFIFVLVIVVGYQSISGQQPHLFNHCLYYIETDSMKGYKEDSFPSDTVIISKLVDEEACYDLVEGDVITFFPTDPDTPSYIKTKTHRIVSIDYDNKTIVTKGDANTRNDTPIEFSDVQAKMVKISPLLSKLLGLLRSFWGFLLFIFIPLAALIVLQIYSYFLEKKKLEYQEQADKLEEEQRKKIEEEAIKEYIEKMKNKDMDI